MSSMLILIYLSAMGVSIALERQEKRQRSEIALACARLGLSLPHPQPRVQMLEALLAISLGIILLSPALMEFRLVLSDPVIRSSIGAGMIDFNIALLAAGATLMFLGSRGVIMNLEFRRKAPSHVRKESEGDVLSSSDRGSGV
jgi:hypothetical protein